jgi:isorenieratene synthase
VSVPEIYHRLDHIDAETFLQNINFLYAARHLAFEVFSRSFFADPADLSAAELATMFHIYFFGSNEGLIFDVPTSNYDTALWQPLRQYLEERDVRFWLDVEALRIDTDSTTFQIHVDSGECLNADAVVLATDVAGLRRILAASSGLADDLWRARIRRLRNAPPFAPVQRLWLDRPIKAHRMAFLGTAGDKPLDNISVLERYEREAGQWARAHRGPVVELHSYALGSAPSGKAAIRQLHQLYPETAEANILLERVLHRSDCPLFAPGSYAHRPAWPVHGRDWYWRVTESASTCRSR